MSQAPHPRRAIRPTIAPSAAAMASPTTGSTLGPVTVATPGPTISAGATATPTAGVTPTADVTPTEAPSSSPLPTPLPRSLADRTDDDPGYQVHVVYALPSDGEDRAFDTDGTLVRSVEAFDAWLLAQTGKQHLRLDRSNGALDITFVRLAGSDSTFKANGLQLRDAIEREIKALGFNHAKKLYAVYYDGTSQSVCGGGPWPPDLPGTVAALYLKGEPRCDQSGWTPDGRTMSYREYAMLHEILHGFGFMPKCAPHQVRAGHTSYSPNDLMFAGDVPWIPSVLDAEGELFGKGACLDLAKSAFLTPSAADAAPPPSWSSSVSR